MSIILIFFCIVIIIFLTIKIYLFSKDPKAFDTNIEQANEALKHIQEVSKWMATVQIGFLAALGAILAGENNAILTINNSFYSFTFLISSLICSSIVLTGIPSISLRLSDNEEPKSYDVLIYPIYSNICEKLPNIGKNLHLGYFVSLQQWFWGCSLLALLILIIDIM